jgi:hypothetical protein
MKVYVLTAGEHMDAVNVGVFTDLNVAHQHAKDLHGAVEEFTLDVFDIRGGKYVPFTEVKP